MYKFERDVVLFDVADGAKDISKFFVKRGISSSSSFDWQLLLLWTEGERGFLIEIEPDI